LDIRCVRSIKVLAARLCLVGSIALGLSLGPSTAATAQGWPSPVAGTSASGDPEILFTFDDGPSPRTTAKVLDILAARHIHAVFFMTADHFMKDPEPARALMARILREGHVIGNHTVNHTDVCADPPEVAAWEIDTARAVLETESGMPVRWFRTPYGSWCPRVVEMLDARGIHNFFWEIDAQEWRTNSAKKTIARITWSLAHLHPRAVVLMHDTKAATVFALPKIFEWLDAENARRVALHLRPVRILDAPGYAREMLGEDTIAELRALVTDAADCLSGGLASALP
jgi:peptidoglycan/xylan/chitin deacetylase (PgdA/CDA1 family)